MRHSQPLVHPHRQRQRQRFRTQLHRRRSQGIRGLSRIPPLHSSPTSAAATDGNIKSSADGLPHHFVLILRLDFSYFQSASAATVRGQRHGDHLIDLLRNRFAVMPAVGGTGLALWWFRVGFPLTAGKGCGLSLVGPLGFFQLALQPFVFLTQPFSFPTKPPLLLAQLFLLSLQFLFSPPQLLVFLAQSLLLAASTAPRLLNGGDLLL